MEIKSVSDFRKAYRNGPSAWPGGYPCYFVTNDGASLSWRSAYYNRRNILESIAGKLNDGWRIVAVEVNYENPSLYCDDTGERIPSAYAEDEAESTVW